MGEGSVAQTVTARALGEQGKRLTAFTAVPRYDTRQTVGPQRFGDETHFAARSAAHWPNVDHHLLDSAHITPLQGIRRTLGIMAEPSHAAGNYFWMTDLLDQAQTHGLGTLLTGQGGNATVSWTGAELAATLNAVKLPARLPVRVEFWREMLLAIAAVALPMPRNWMVAVLPAVEIVPFPVELPP